MSRRKVRRAPPKLAYTPGPDDLLLCGTCGHARGDHVALGDPCVHVVGDLLTGVTICGCRAFVARKEGF